MAGFHTDSEKKTIDNDDFRGVRPTAPVNQLVGATLKPDALDTPRAHHYG